VADYNRIRDMIADTIPGFTGFNERLQSPGGFHLGNTAADRNFRTATGKARFMPHALPEELVNAKVLARGDKPDLILQTLRSHDQYNTTIYGLDDRYRGVFGQREVVFVNEADIRRLGFEPGEQVDLVSLWEDGVERRVSGFRLVAYDVPEGRRRTTRRPTRWCRWKVMARGPTPRPRNLWRSVEKAKAGNGLRRCWQRIDGLPVPAYSRACPRRIQRRFRRDAPGKPWCTSSAPWQSWR
jgi:anaerobic selenocysteine-containing dehydrogenase